MARESVLPQAEPGRQADERERILASNGRHEGTTSENGKARVLMLWDMYTPGGVAF